MIESGRLSAEVLVTDCAVRVTTVGLGGARTHEIPPETGACGTSSA